MSSSASRSACSANPSELNSFSASRTLLLISFSFVRKFRCCSSFLRSTAVCFITADLRSRAALKYPCKVRVTTDSRYVVDGITKGWAQGWKKRGWKKSDGKPALNPELWERLLELLAIHDVEFAWIKGHAGHEENERCDRLAVAQRDLHSGK